MRLIISVFVILICAGFANAQELIYSVNWKEDSIGYLIANKEAKPDEEHYVIRSNTNFRVLFNFNLNYYFENRYRNGRLYSAFTKNALNQKDRDASSIFREKDYYKVTVNDEVNLLTDEGILFTVSKMYHQEPIGINRVFSERFGEYLNLEKIKDSTYVITKPDGRQNTYFYNNGICWKVRVENPILTIYFNLLNDLH